MQKVLVVASRRFGLRMAVECAAGCGAGRLRAFDPGAWMEDAGRLSAFIFMFVVCYGAIDDLRLSWSRLGRRRRFHLAKKYL